MKKIYFSRTSKKKIRIFIKVQYLYVMGKNFYVNVNFLMACIVQNAL